MRKPFLFAYTLAATLGAWSLLAQNYEFLIYTIVTLALVTLIYLGDRKFTFSPTLLWGFNLWLVLHILGGLWQVNDGVLYSLVLLDIVGEPYSILKYDQLVHAYCYFIIALLLWRVVATASLKAPHWLIAALTVLAASGVGGLNEIVEFSATVLVPNTNVGGYENTAIDLVANFIGACLAILCFKEH
ncbi:MAG: DUF2238 domain-containing protein [Porticoccaceae bacterium]